jgi:heme exporter protein C
MGLGIAALVTLGVTVALGLTLPKTVEQAEYSRLIAIHPGIAWTTYVASAVAAIASVLWLIPRTRNPRWDLLAGASAEIGAVFCALMLVTGSIWGRPTWGVYWVWDARLTLSALMLALLLGYLAIRAIPAEPDVRAKRCAMTAVLGALVIPVNHFAVEWWRTLHQSRSLADLTPKDSLDGAFIGAMLLGFIAFTLVYAWLMVHRVRVMRIEEAAESAELADAIEERRREALV